MEMFKGAKAVRLRGRHNKYLVADEDEEHVSQDRNGASRAARWTVEIVPSASSTPAVLRLKSCYGRYLTASNHAFLLGATGHKVTQTLPPRPDSSVEWEPLRDGFQVKLKTRYGNFLRANGGLPPWRNSVTHDIPHRTATQDWVLWDLDVVDLHLDASAPPVIAPSSPTLEEEESLSSTPPVSPHKTDGRIIYYTVAGDHDDGDVNEEDEGPCFTFKGTSVAELTEKLEEETGITGIYVCSRNPVNKKLYPLRLHLPPNNAMMRVVVVPEDSKVDGLCLMETCALRARLVREIDVCPPRGPYFFNSMIPGGKEFPESAGYCVGLEEQGSSPCS